MRFAPLPNPINKDAEKSRGSHDFVVGQLFMRRALQADVFVPPGEVASDITCAGCVDAASVLDIL